MSSPEPLRGVRVVEFGHYVAGPLAGVLLADQGAEVVRVDRPGAPDASHAADMFLGRGKRRVTLDLNAAADRATARALVARADVVIENFRPGVMDRFGLGWADLRESCPRLIYLSLPGFAPDDPRAKVRAFEGVIAAASDNCRLRPSQAPDGWDLSRPTYSAVPIASNFAALLGVVGVAAALIERQRSGRGQHVSVPLYDAMFEAIGDQATYATSDGKPKPEFSTGVFLGGGIYRCADDRYLQFNPLGATARFRNWFLQEVGHPDWALLDDQALLERLVGMFAARPAAHWEQLGQGIGVPMVQIRSTREWLATPHARASGAVVQLDDPMLGPTWMAGIPLHVGTEQGPDGLDHPLQPRHVPDADRSDILAELERPEQPRAGQTAGAVAGIPRVRPLTGVRVLDLTQILAGPTSGRILGELGAEVVKVNAPQRPVAVHPSVNRGKESILVDVEHPDGQDVFWRLVQDSDVVVHNFPPGTAERYGIGYETVDARRPGIVYASVSCYGGPGPWSHGRGYETEGQALTGFMTRAGGARPPIIYGPYTVCDYGTGVLTAFAVLLGLYRHAETGDGLLVRTSLAQTATLHQATLDFEYPGRSTSTDPAGIEALGRGPLMRFYRAADRWFFLGATDADLPRLDQVEGLAGAAALDDPEELATWLESVFATAPAVEWVRALRAADLGAHEVTTLAEMMTDPVNVDRGLSLQQVYGEVGGITTAGVSIALSDTPARVGRPARPPGSDAVQVLERIGLGHEVTRLEKRWAVQTENLPAGWP